MLQFKIIFLTLFCSKRNHDYIAMENNSTGVQTASPKVGTREPKTNHTLRQNLSSSPFHTRYATLRFEWDRYLIRYGTVFLVHKHTTAERRQVMVCLRSIRVRDVIATLPGRKCRSNTRHCRRIESANKYKIGETVRK